MVGTGSEALDASSAEALKGDGHDVTLWAFVDRNDLQVDGCEVVVLGLGLQGCEPDPDGVILELRRQGVRVICLAGRKEDAGPELLQKIVPLGVYDIVWDGPDMVAGVLARVRKPATLDDGLRALQTPGEPRGIALPRLWSGWRGLIAARLPVGGVARSRAAPERPAAASSAQPTAEPAKAGPVPEPVPVAELPGHVDGTPGQEQPPPAPEQEAARDDGGAVPAPPEVAARAPAGEQPVAPAGEHGGGRGRFGLRLPRPTRPRGVPSAQPEPAAADAAAGTRAWPAPRHVGLTLAVFGALPRVGATSALVAWAGEWGHEAVLVDANAERPGGLALALGRPHPALPWWEGEEVVPGDIRLIGLPPLVGEVPGPDDMANLLIERVRRLHRAEPLTCVAVDCGSPSALADTGLAHASVIMAAEAASGVAVVTRDDPAALIAARGFVNALRACGAADVRIWLQGSTAAVAEEVERAMGVDVDAW